MMKFILLALALSFNASAQQLFPSRAVRVVVPFPPGGTTDTLARLVSPRMSAALGQPVIVDNRPGGGGLLAADVVSKSAPDGYTVLLTPCGLAIAPALYRKLAFDASRDFSPVTHLISTELMLVANAKFQASSVSEFIALAKAKPGSLNYGSAGVGTVLHLTMEMLKSAAGLDLQGVQYKGDGPMNTALIADEVQVGIAPVASSQVHIRSGRLRALATTSASRLPAFPEVPTLAESGVPGFESSCWQGFFVAANTPREIVQRLQQDAVRSLRSPEVLERLPTLGQVPVGSTPEEFEAKFKADLTRFARIVREARIPSQD
jgi:tripartite-type tricarboxylate transporter receptor subunit TctC